MYQTYERQCSTYRHFTHLDKIDAESPFLLGPTSGGGGGGELGNGVKIRWFFPRNFINTSFKPISNLVKRFLYFKNSRPI